MAPRAPVLSRGFARESVAESARESELSALHQRYGNRATGLLLQAKLRVGEPNDRYEREADHVADTVMRTTDPVAEELHPVGGASLIQPCSCGGTCASCSSHKKEDDELLAQREAISAAPLAMVQRDATESCAVKDEAPEPEETAEQEDEAKAVEGGEKQEEEAAATEGSEEEPDDTKPSVQRKGRGTATATPESVEARIEQTRGNGVTLPRDTRQFMESRLGQDFSGVRVHTDATSHVLNRDLNSLAFTTGRDIYFAPGQFQPGTSSGKHLLAHELTHVVQQAGGRGGVVREKADPNVVSRRTRPERKSYYYSVHRVSGTSIHHVLERLLRLANTGLVTEAAIPGADRFYPRLNKIGVADLYASTPPHTVTGVKGFRDVDKPEDVVAMNNPESVHTQPPDVRSSPRRTGTGPQRGWTGTFPSKILIGEIKPLSASKLGAGIIQLDSYARGYKDFVERVYNLSGQTTGASIDVARMQLNLPPNLNWDFFEAQSAAPSSESTTPTRRRFWIASVGGGVYVYFDLDAGLRGGQPPRFAQEIARMREVRQDLTRETPRTEPLDAMPVDGKFLPGPRNISPLPGASKASLVQRR